MSARSTPAAPVKSRAKKQAAITPKGKAAARAPKALALPARRTYEPRLEKATMADLPFTEGGRFGDPLKAWAPSKVTSYGDACLLGMEYAAHWLQFVKDGESGNYVYTLERIVRDMDFADASDAKGCIIGFLAHIERVVRRAVPYIDVYQELDLASAHLRPQREPETRGGERGHTT